MGPVWYAVRADLRAGWIRTAGVVLLLAIGGGAVLSLAGGVSRTLSAPDRYSASIGGEYDVSVEQFNGRPRTKEIAALPAVADVEMATFVFGGVSAQAGDAPIDGLVFAGHAAAFGGRVVEGREPDRTAAGEFVATRSWAEGSGAALGDRFRLVTLTQQQADERGFDVARPAGPVLTATLVGLIEGPNDLEESFPVVVFPPTLLDVHDTGAVGVSASNGVVDLAAGATLADLRSQLDGVPGSFGVEHLEWVPPELRSAVDAQGQGLAVVTVVVGGAAIAVLGQLLVRRSRRPTAHRLVMRSLGSRRRQIIAEPVVAAAVPIVAGCVAAGVLAYLASGMFPYGFAARVEPSAGLRIEPLVHGLGPVVLAGALVGWVLLAQPSFGRGRARRPTTSGPLSGRLGTGPAATGARFVLTPPAHDVITRAPLLGQVVVLAGLVAALVFGASLDRFLEEPARYGYNFDFATGAGGDAVPAELRALLEDDPDIVDVTLYGTELATAGSVALDVTGMEQIRGVLEPDVLSGRLARRPDEIALGAVASRDMGAKVGEEVVLSGEGGQHEFVVTGIVVVPSVEGGDGVGEGAVVTHDGLLRISPDAVLGVAAARVRPGADVATRIERSTGIGAGLPDRPPSVLNMERIRSTPYIVAGCLSALMMLSLAHQLITNIRRRRGELAILRALGADRRWITGVVHWYAVALAAAIVVVGGPLGVTVGRVTYRTYIGRVGARNDGSVPLLVLTLGIVALLIAANLVAAIPARRARRSEPGRVLAGE